MTDEARSHWRRMVAGLYTLAGESCESCKAVIYHLLDDEHPRRWCTEAQCPHRSGPPTHHAQLIQSWAATPLTTPCGDSGDGSLTPSSPS